MCGCDGRLLHFVFRSFRFLAMNPFVLHENGLNMNVFWLPTLRTTSLSHHNRSFLPLVQRLLLMVMTLSSLHWDSMDCFVWAFVSCKLNQWMMLLLLSMPMMMV